MKSPHVLAVTVLLLGSPLFGRVVAQPKEREDLTVTIRKLEKDIAEVRGLPFKTPVVAKIIARPADADKALFVYDDIAGNYERGVLIHEMVHAWQDQQFGLAALHQSSFGSDSELALAALVEGDATFTMIEMLQKDQPAVAKMLDSPLEKSKNLRNAFLYAQGARYVKALKERGGWAAVNAAYKNPPRTTAAVLFPDAKLIPINLGPGKSQGAYGILQTLAAHADVAPQALPLAGAWRGDRTVEGKEAQAWVIAFAMPKDAAQFHQELAKLRKLRSPDLQPLPDDATIFQEKSGAVQTDLIVSDRVWVMKAAGVKQLRALRDRLASPPLTVWSNKDKRFLSFGQFVDKLADYDTICVGENHDGDLHHHVQLRIIKALFAQDENLGVGMEMFQRPFQPALDRYIRGELSEEAFLQESEYQKRWGFPWGMYRPIVDFSRKNGIPIAALNAPRELTQRISKVGKDGLNEEEKTQLGEIDFQVKEHRDYWFDRLGKMHGKTKVPVEIQERSYQVMTIWDGFMAQSAARFQKERGLRRLVILAGEGHIDRGFGIPARTARLTGGKVATVHVEVGSTAAHAIADPPTDFIVFVEAKSLSFHGEKVAPAK